MDGDERKKPAALPASRAVCVRRWNSDGAENRMDMAAAVENLRRHHPSQSPADIEAQLLCGNVLHTELASFRAE